MKCLSYWMLVWVVLLLAACGDSVSGNNDEDAENALPSSSAVWSTLSSSSSFSLLSSSDAASSLLSVSVASVPGVVVSAFLNYPDIAFPQGLVSVNLTNRSAAKKNVRVKLEILGFSDPLVESVEVSGKSEKRVALTPVLKAGVFDVLNKVENVTITLSVMENTDVLYEQTLKSKLTANNVMAWGYNDKGTVVRYDTLLAGWVTPGNQSVKNIISTANGYLQSGYAFSGYQKAPLVYMTRMTLDNLCCASDVGSARDPYFSISGPGSVSYVSTTKTDNALAKLTWTMLVQLSQPGSYEIVIKDEDLSSDDPMGARTLVLPDSFFTKRLNSYTNNTEGVALTAEWHYAPAKQAEAIYKALRAQNMVYVNSAGLDFGLAQGDMYKSGEYMGQAIRLPSQSLASKSFNCIDGAVLFASALENVGIDAIIVLVTGHAYVGWYNDAEHSSIDVLETTLIPTADFAAANQSARVAYASDLQDPLFRIVNVKQARQKGILPLQ